jgi:hypothetical protein
VPYGTSADVEIEIDLNSETAVSPTITVGAEDGRANGTASIRGRIVQRALETRPLTCRR